MINGGRVNLDKMIGTDLCPATRLTSLFGGMRQGRARGKGATFGRIDWRRRISLQNDSLAATFNFGIGHGNGTHQRLGIIMIRSFRDPLRRAKFDEFAEIHDGDSVGDVFNDGKVVSDKDHGQIHLADEAGEEIQNLTLDGDIEGAHRFVGEDQARLGGEGAGDGDALALPAAEFVGIFFHLCRVQADAPHEGGDACGQFGGGEVLACAEGFGEATEDGHPGVEGGVGILENHLKIRAFAAHGLWAERGEIAAFEQDTSGGRSLELHDGAGKGGFAAAAFTDEAEDFSLAQLQRNAIDGFDGGDLSFKHGAGINGEVRADMVENQKRGVVRGLVVHGIRAGKRFFLSSHGREIRGKGRL